MEEIIAPVDKELLKAELNEKRFLRDTNHAGNKLYIVDNACAPNVLREIGRLREIAFRAGGGGTGKSADLDEFDLDGAFKYKQLVLWDPDAECIIGGYRYVLCDNVMYDRCGQPIMPSAHLFKFTRRYLKGAFLKTIELSRSFIRPEYQSSEQGMKSLYSLDNLFDGLGGLIVLYKGRMEYFFGKMTIYPSFPEEGLQMLLYFLRKHFGTWENDLMHRLDRMVIPKQPVKIKLTRKFDNILTEKDFREDYKILKREIQKMGVNIPPLVNTYMNLSPTMKSFGAGINDEFGNVIEAGILIKFDELHPEKTRRHLSFPKLFSRRPF
ncbi:MAG: GNAT family N-acetyltransferase [Bacteroidales bacterium]|nr:GNAT family N-acetyltransferase [Bacteroidales bacterium]MBQ2194495.1 GNAT family N-acetyltransferase [Bacteroidales bacterium]MBQ5528922.1 GNAT family N-acetyltransferase [Bacteroidales bacterium]MBR6869518.1 GNAT family N-acetyltransferase [Bacteroidales bacterium]